MDILGTIVTELFDSKPRKRAINAFSSTEPLSKDEFMARMLNLAELKGLPLLTENDILLLYGLKTEKKRKKTISKMAKQRLVWVNVIGEGENIKIAKMNAINSAIEQTCGLTVKPDEDGGQIALASPGRVMEEEILVEDDSGMNSYVKMDVLVYRGPCGDELNE